MLLFLLWSSVLTIIRNWNSFNNNFTIAHGQTHCCVHLNWMNANPFIQNLKRYAINRTKAFIYQSQLIIPTWSWNWRLMHWNVCSRCQIIYYSKLKHFHSLCKHRIASHRIPYTKCAKSWFSYYCRFSYLHSYRISI